MRRPRSRHLGGAVQVMRTASLGRVGEGMAALPYQSIR